MNKVLIIPKQIVTADESRNIFSHHGVEISGDTISDIIDLKLFDSTQYTGKIVHHENLTLIPGFVQTHIHLCQTLFRGLADDMLLLDWLQNRIFPFENSHSENSLRLSAQIGITELLEGGTTTIMDMGTIRHERVIFEELAFSGMRAIAGKCMMDRNDLYPDFVESTKDSLKQSYDLASEYHNSENGRIKYGFAPRFVLSCSEELLVETKHMVKDFEGSMYHTHSSENKGEIEEVMKLTGKENIEYFDSIGILGEDTLLAHGIHVNNNEVESLKRTGTKISHCPSSNLKLGSGIANIPNYLNEGISISLGADGAPCNNNLSAFTEMRLSALIQKPIHNPTSMDAETVFRLATIEGAKALGMGDEIGSVEIGKKADFVLLDLEKPALPLINENKNVYSSIVYSANNSEVAEVYVAGKNLVLNGKSISYDSDKLLNDGKSELQKLIKNSGINL